MKLLVLGYARHGKDSVCGLLGLPWISSSEFAGRKVVWPRMQDRYETWEQCFEDRHNHRETWFQLISEYNRDNPARLCSEVLEHSDVYCGMRAAREFEASRHLVDLTIWVDAVWRLGYNDPTMGITADQCDLRIDNNGSLEDLKHKIQRIKACLLR